METTEFFARVLPGRGLKFLFLARSKKHVAVESSEQLAYLAKRADDRNQEVYFACASYREPSVIIEGKQRSRVGDNVDAVRSFWIDIDCGPDKPYNDKKSAAIALGTFVRSSQLPTPLIVDSGGGFHAYWCLDRDLTPVEWKAAAPAFARWVSRHITHDTKCAIDIARVLRPPGTYNRKQEVPRPVTVLNDGEIISTDAFFAVISAQISATFPVIAPVSNDLGAGITYPPSSALRIADQCAAIALVRDTLGKVNEPLWYAALGVLKHTIEGEEICQEWSSGHPEYNAEATAKKIAQWKHGPTTCANFEGISPDRCKQCKHRALITSPIQLGVEPPELELPPTEDFDPDSFTFPEILKNNYTVRSGYLCINKPKDGVQNYVAFCETFFYPETHHDAESTGHQTVWRKVTHGKSEIFTLDSKDVGSGGSTLLGALGAKGIVAMSSGKIAMEAYVRDWFNALKRQVDSTPVFSKYGWQEDWSFLIGDQQYLPDGSSQTVRLEGDASDPIYAGAFRPQGTLKEWVDLVNETYNYPGQQQYQFMLGVGFGAPLIRLFENYGGLTVHGYSPQKGLGKSTAGKLALGIYGNPKLLTRTKQQVSIKAFNAHCGLMNSLPVLMDEATNIDQRELSDMVYTFSQGTPRLTLQRTGQMNTIHQSWSTMMLTTANRSLVNLLGASKANADAEMGRVVEFQFDRVSTLDKVRADAVLARAETLFGTAGDAYIRYIVSNREKVSELLRKVQIDLDQQLGTTVQERFLSIGIAATVTGLMIAKSLGLVGFDLAALRQWIVLRTRDLKDAIAQNLPGIEDAFGRMLAELAPGVLVTKTEGDSRQGISAQRVNTVHGTVHGRLILDQSKLYLHQTVVRQWCAKNQADFTDMMAMAKKKEWLDGPARMILLTKGVNDHVSTAVVSLVFNWQKMVGVVSEETAAKLYVVQ